jgi:hypothetical protein
MTIQGSLGHYRKAIFRYENKIPKNGKQTTEKYIIAMEILVQILDSLKSGNTFNISAMISFSVKQHTVIHSMKTHSL